MDAASAKASYSTHELAERWGVNVSKVGEWIRTGELRAINVAKSLQGNRPRYRVSDEAVREFEHRRSVVQEAAPSTIPRRRRQSAAVVNFF